jgi:hypothetical protein
MIEPLSSFYLTKLIGRLIVNGKSDQIDPHTLTIKFGMSKNVPKRGIKSEFLAYANSSTKNNPSKGKFEVTEEMHLLSVNGILSSCMAPESMILEFEDFVNNRFYVGCPRLFGDAGTKGSKHEYLEVPPEVQARTDYLVKTIMKFADQLAELKPQFLELTDDSKALRDRIYDDYKGIFDNIKKQLNNYGLKPAKKIRAAAAPQPVAQSAAPTTQPVYENPFDNLPEEWTLVTYKGSHLVGLQHNEFHAVNKVLKDPNKDGHVLLADPTKKGARFQFHDNETLAGKYRPYNINANKVIDILTAAGKVRVFDASQLPPKASRMKKAAVSTPTPPTPVSKPVTNGVNHDSSVSFTMR